MGKIIAVVNAKGGVGKTTIAVNLAAGLARLKKQVLVIDMDNQCDTTTCLAFDRKKLSPNLFNLLTGGQDVPPVNIIQKTRVPNLFLLPGSNIIASLEPQIIRSGGQGIMRLRDLLRDHATTTYDYTILDCPPNLGSFVLMASIAADYLVIPVEADSSRSIRGMRDVLNFLHDARQDLNADLQLLGVIVNKLDKRTKKGRATVESLNTTLGPDKVFSTLVPRCAHFAHAESVQRCIFDYYIHSPGCVAFASIAQETVGLLEGFGALPRTNVCIDKEIVAGFLEK